MCSSGLRSAFGSTSRGSAIHRDKPGGTSRDHCSKRSGHMKRGSNGKRCRANSPRFVRQPTRHSRTHFQYCVIFSRQSKAVGTGCHFCVTRRLPAYTPKRVCISFGSCLVQVHPVARSTSRRRLTKLSMPHPLSRLTDACSGWSRTGRCGWDSRDGQQFRQPRPRPKLTYLLRCAAK